MVRRGSGWRPSRGAVPVLHRAGGCAVGAGGRGAVRGRAGENPDRLFCHMYGRGKDNAQMIPGLAVAWDRLHPRLPHRAAWEDHDDGELPIIEGTLIRLQVDHLPGDRDPKPMWLWASRTGASPQEVDRLWQAFLRRFGTHLPAVQAGPGLDRVEDPRRRGRGAVDLADHRVPRPAPPCPCAGRRPAPPLGTARPARAAHSGPGAPGLPGTSARSPAVRPVRQNLASPALGGHPAPRTAARAGRHDVGKNREQGTAKPVSKKQTG
jgi:hypothetical protein